MTRIASKLFVMSSRNGITGHLARRALRTFCACDVSAGAKFLAPPNLHHAIAIVVGKGVVIGHNVTLYQGVTIGGSRSGKYPHIGDNVVIYPNATVAGGVTIGDNAIIGANALIMDDVPPNTIVRVIPTPIPSPASKIDTL